MTAISLPNDVCFLVLQTLDHLEDLTILAKCRRVSHEFKNIVDELPIQKALKEEALLGRKIARSQEDLKLRCGKLVHNFFNPYTANRRLPAKSLTISGHYLLDPAVRFEIYVRETANPSSPLEKQSVSFVFTDAALLDAGTALHDEWSRRGASTTIFRRITATGFAIEQLRQRIIELTPQNTN